VNERIVSELRPIDVLDNITAIMKISKVVETKEDRVKSKEYLHVVSKNVATFNTDFDKILREGLPSN